jgi:antitoxin MazE
MLVSRWGNSLAVRLPKSLVDALGIVEGDEFEMTALDDKRILVRRQDADEFLMALRKLQKPKPQELSWTRDEANER